jgi:hypothetical protein
MMLGRILGVMVWGAVIGGPGTLCALATLLLIWQIVAACSGGLGLQHVIVPSFISFCELIPGSRFFWHSAEQG